MPTYIAGFSLSLSLILAIGSQNAFVLKQGLKNQHVLIVCTICAISDAILISFGVLGVGSLLEKFPEIELIARYMGAIFLMIYAFFSFYSALTKSHAIDADMNSRSDALKAVSACLAFTWLNPHVYLDTVVLLGSISTQYQPQEGMFALGAMTASFMFFFSLGYGARVLEPLFRKPAAWKILEFMVGMIMLVLALNLIV